MTLATIVKWGLAITGAVSVSCLALAVIAAWRRGEFKRPPYDSDDYGANDF